MAKIKHLHPIVEHPIAAAIRSMLSIPLIMGMDTSLAIARSLGQLYPTLAPSRFARSIEHLTEAFPTWTDAQRRDCAIKAYEHLFQLGVEVLHAPRLITKEGYTRHLAMTHIEPAVKELLKQGPCVLITGHCGNWELIGYAISMLGFPVHAVYRPLDLRPLDAWLYETRARRGLTLVSKFGAVKALPPIISEGKPAGLVADQSGGDRGLFTPFFGRLTSTYKSIGLLALQTNARFICGFARRLRPDEPLPDGPPTRGHDHGHMFDSGPGSPPSMRYAIELIDMFGPDDWHGQPDPLFYITARYRRAIEQMVRRAPEQYLWMHRMWRSRPAHERHNKPFPPALRDKLAALPWMTPADLDALIARSERDREAVAASKKA